MPEYVIEDRQKQGIVWDLIVYSRVLDSASYSSG